MEPPVVLVVGQIARDLVLRIDVMPAAGKRRRRPRAA
jgi:hypothetical protein